MDSQQQSSNIFNAFTSKSHQVSPCDATIPEGAWQEEESLEVYKKKRTQRPPADGRAEIIRFVKRRPKSSEQIYETVQPRRDGRRELILLEPVQFSDEPPDTLYDDYSLYRMEEYVDAGTEICERDKEPVYYTIQKVEKAPPAMPEKEKRVKEECIAPAKEMDTITFVEEERKSVERLSSREDLTTIPALERGPYVSTVPVGDVSVEPSLERGSDAGRSEKAYSRSGEISRETPLLDRTVYYEREIVQGEKPAEKEEIRDSRAASRQTTIIDDEIFHANKRVDSVLRGAHETIRESPMQTLPTVPEEDYHEEDRDSFQRERTSQQVVKSKTEYKETRREMTQKKETSIPIIQAPSRASDARHSCERSHMYERIVQAPSPRPASTLRSTSAPSRPSHTPYCPHCRIVPREHERCYEHDRSFVRDIPVQKERYSSTSQRSRMDEGRVCTESRTTPVHETITTERFERIEKVRRKFPATTV
ncbi:hypothetical protein RB195_020314 [Necator americanus]|uniref:Uncharacterized protein n=1 Tax=Necator americanus TaxID=51031 RepID=A0ABR1CI88_NECAM